MSNTFYVIGIGPGDPELLTLKACKVLNAAPCICVPKGREEGSSLALAIVQKALDLSGKEIIEAHFPMRKTRRPNESTNDKTSGLPDFRTSDLDAKWDETAENIISRLDKGVDIAFITLGDPTIYSTFFYLYDRLLALKPDLNIEIIPGVSSINAAAAKAGISLGLANEKIAILPANYLGDLENTLSEFDTIVLMKVNRVFNNVLQILDKLDLTGKAVYVSRAGMEDEMIVRDIKKVSEADLNYFSMLIVKK
jgi:precorrin-2/cobalt-factor-2 C20-methyltransferase